MTSEQTVYGHASVWGWIITARTRERSVQRFFHSLAKLIVTWQSLFDKRRPVDRAINSTFGPCGSFALDFDLRDQELTFSVEDDASQSSEPGWPEWKVVAFGFSHSVLLKAEVVICDKQRSVSENLLLNT